MSNFDITACLPIFSKASPKSLAELIFNLNRSLVSTASLNDSPSGADKFMMGLTFVLCTTAIIGFWRNPLTGTRLKGPATKPFLTQVAMASVIHMPFLWADRTFFAFKGPKDFLSFVRAPPSALLRARFAVSLCAGDQSNQHF